MRASRLLGVAVALLAAAAAGGCALPITSPDGEPVARVVLVGDSIISQSQQVTADALAAVGVETWTEGHAGSGLLNGPVDWVVRLQQILALYPDADLVAIELAGNFWSPYEAGTFWPPYAVTSAVLVEPDSPEFFALWQEEAQRLVDSVRGNGISVAWILSPPMGGGFTSRTAALDDGYRELEGSTITDSGAALADAEGALALERTECGDGPLREPDLVHLSELGSTVYGTQIAHDLAALLDAPPVEPIC